MTTFVTMGEYQRVCDERDELREQCAFLASEQHSAERASLNAVCQNALGLTPGETAMVLALYFAPRRFLSTAALNAQIPTFRADERDAISIWMWVHKVRGKLGACALETVYGRGYRLTAHGVSLVEAAVGLKAA